MARIPANWSRSSRRAGAAADRGLGKPLLPADAGPPPARRRSAGDIASSSSGYLRGSRPGDQRRRRNFITVLAGATAWIFAARAQEHRRVARTSTPRCRSERGGLEACAGWLVADRCSQAARVRTLDGISRDQLHSAAPVSNVPHSSPNLQRGAGILPIKMIRTHDETGYFGV